MRFYDNFGETSEELRIVHILRRILHIEGVHSVLKSFHQRKFGAAQRFAAVKQREDAVMAKAGGQYAQLVVAHMGEQVPVCNAAANGCAAAYFQLLSDVWCNLSV